MGFKKHRGKFFRTDQCSGMNALSAHLVVGQRVDTDALLEQVNSTLREQFKIDHTTIQIETVDRQPQETAV